MGRRVLGAAISAWILSGAVTAQVARGTAAPPGITVHRPAAPAPPPATPEASRPPHHHHHDRLAAPEPGGDLFLAGPETYAPRFDRLIRPKGPFRSVPYGFVGGGSVVPVLQAPLLPKRDRDPDRLALLGFLRLRMAPPLAQVYVDGVFVGAVSDFRNAPYVLPAGTYHVEIRADGFEPRAFDVRIRAGQTVTYSGDLAESPAASAPALPPAAVALPPAAAAVPQVAAKTIYVIPRCYAGDRPPVVSQLPEGCSVSAVRVIPPVAP